MLYLGVDHQSLALTTRTTSNDQNPQLLEKHFQKKECQTLAKPKSKLRTKSTFLPNSDDNYHTKIPLPLCLHESTHRVQASMRLFK
ncbi:unnamed protein product, partial [Linum tenue]